MARECSQSPFDTSLPACSLSEPRGEWGEKWKREPAIAALFREYTAYTSISPFSSWLAQRACWQAIETKTKTI